MCFSTCSQTFKWLPFLNSAESHFWRTFVGKWPNQNSLSPKKDTYAGSKYDTNTHTHNQHPIAVFDMSIFQVSQWEALLKELAWDGSYTQKRLWPRTGTAGVIATKLQQAIFLMLKESTQLRTCCGSCRNGGVKSVVQANSKLSKKDHVSFFPWMHPHPKKKRRFFSQHFPRINFQTLS